MLLALDAETVVLPRRPRIAAERETNPFERAWVYGDSEQPCRVSGQEATLLLWAPDYDCGHKALVRFPDGREAIRRRLASSAKRNARTCSRPVPPLASLV